MTSPSIRPLRRTLLKLALALSILPVAGLAPALAGEAKPDAIRIGSTAPGHLKFILYRHKKLLEDEFSKEGIKIELTTFDGGSAATVALGSGALDFTYIGNNPSLRLAATGADVKLIGLSSWNRSNETQIVVKPDSPIRKIEDLKGKKVAYLSGTVRHSTFAKALKAAGVSIGDVESLNLGIESSGPALARGDVDAIVESTGPVQKLVEEGQARVIFDAGVSGSPEWAVPHLISVNGDFARKYPQIVARLLAVDVAAARWADANPEETIAIFVEETGNSDKAVRATYPNGKFYQDPEITDAAVRALQGGGSLHGRCRLAEGQGRLPDMDRPVVLRSGDQKTCRQQLTCIRPGRRRSWTGAPFRAFQCFMETPKGSNHLNHALPGGKALRTFPGSALAVRDDFHSLFAAPPSSHPDRPGGRRRGLLHADARQHDHRDVAAGHGA